MYFFKNWSEREYYKLVSSLLVSKYNFNGVYDILKIKRVFLVLRFGAISADFLVNFIFIFYLFTQKYPKLLKLKFKNKKSRKRSKKFNLYGLQLCLVGSEIFIFLEYLKRFFFYSLELKKTDLSVSCSSNFVLLSTKSLIKIFFFLTDSIFMRYCIFYLEKYNYLFNIYINFNTNKNALKLGESLTILRSSFLPLKLFIKEK